MAMTEKIYRFAKGHEWQNKDGGRVAMLMIKMAVFLISNRSSSV